MRLKETNKKAVAKSGVVSKTAFVEYPRFEVNTDIPQKEYTSKTTKKRRFMVALKGKPTLTEAMRKCTTVIDGVIYVHVDSENTSGQVQFGHPVWMNQNPDYVTFMNVAGSPEDDYKAKIAKINDLEKQGVLDKEFADERRRQAKADYCKALGI